MANKKKAAPKVVKKTAPKKSAKPAKKAAKSAKPTKKAPAKPATKAPVKAKPKTKVKPAAKSAKKAPVKPGAKVAAKPEPKPAAKSLPSPSAKPELKTFTPPKPRRGRRRKIKENEGEKPSRKVRQAGPESVANVSFQKSESFASRAAAAAKQQIKINTDTRSRYSDKELEEFRVLIEEKLAAARNELKYLQDQVNRKDDNGTDDTENKFSNMEDGTLTQEREYLTQMASRQVQYIENLEKALVRIQNKTYGICRVTGKLIDKDRLRIVPHATLSMEAKMMQK
jgi:RNA polymerase-binding transcription factor DksA